MGGEVMGSDWAPAGAANFRDVAGVAGIARVLRPGTVYRSDSPQFLTPDGAAELIERTGIRLVLDLRYSGESEAEGSGPLSGQADLRLINRPIVGSAGEDIEMAVPAGGVAAGDLLSQHYVSCLQTSGAELVQTIRDITDADGLPVLIHCAAGKDRTGLLVALIESVLGADRDAIVEDYAITDANMPAVLANMMAGSGYAESVASHRPDDERPHAYPDTMRSLLDWLEREYGSAENYLIEHGLEPVRIDRLRSMVGARRAA